MDGRRMSGCDPAAHELARLLPETARGPRRDGIFALWLTVRVAQDTLLEPPLPDRLQKRRLAALEARLSSLTIAAPLRRALAGAMLHLREGGPGAAATVLSQLAAPARETLSAEVAEILTRNAQAARQATRERG
jgi:hypothetical protein